MYYQDDKYYKPMIFKSNYLILIHNYNCINRLISSACNKQWNIIIHFWSYHQMIRNFSQTRLTSFHYRCHFCTLQILCFKMLHVITPVPINWHITSKCRNYVLTRVIMHIYLSITIVSWVAHYSKKFIMNCGRSEFYKVKLT